MTLKRTLPAISWLALIALAILAIVAPEYLLDWPAAFAAAPTFVGNTFDGDFLQRAVTRAVTGNQTVDGGHVYVRDGVRSSLNMQRLKVENIIQDRQETPTSQGAIELSKRRLTTNDYMIYIEFNPRNFEGHYFEGMLSGETVFSELPPEIQGQFTDRSLRQNDHDLDKAIWQGDTAGTAPFDKFDGLITLLAADPGTIDVTSPVTLTASNIIDKLTDSLDLVPEAIMQEANLKCFMSPKTHRLYGDALRNLTNKSIAPEDGPPAIFEGKRLVPLVGFPNDTLLWAVSSADLDSNLWMGAASVQDAQAIQIDKVSAASELFFFKMLLKVGTQIAFPEETVLYKV